MARTKMVKQITFPIDLDDALRKAAYEDRRSQSGILAVAFEEWNNRRTGEVEPDQPEPDRLGI
jgi:hypothetical protein